MPFIRVAPRRQLDEPITENQQEKQIESTESTEPYKPNKTISKKEQEIQDITERAKEVWEADKQIAKSSAKIVGMGAQRLGEQGGGLLGTIIEAPSNLTKLAYNIAGKEEPEWTKDPMPIRLNKHGEPRWFLKTPEEIRETTLPYTKDFTAPENAFEEVVDEVENIASGLVTSGIVEGPILAASTAGTYAVRKAGKGLGVPDKFQALAELGIQHGAAGAGGVRSSIESATAEGRRLANISQREGFQHTPAAVLAGQRWSTRFLNEVGRAGPAVVERVRQFGQDVERVYHDVLSNIYRPFEREHNLLVLQDGTKDLYTPVRTISRSNPVQLRVQNIVTSIDNQLALMNTQSPSAAETAAMNILNRDRETFLQQGINLDQGVSTFQSYNKHVKDWNSITKNDLHLIAVKEVIRDELLRTGQPIQGFNESFNAANVGYTAFKDLENTVQLMRGAFSPEGDLDLNRFSNTVLNAENAHALVETMGAQEYNRLREVAELSREAANHFDNVDALLTPHERSNNRSFGLAGGLISKGATAAAKISGLNAAASFFSWVLTNPNLHSNYLGYLRSIRNESPKLVAHYVRKLSEGIEEEKRKEQEQKQESKQKFRYQRVR